MSNIEDEKFALTRTIQFRCPEVLASAMQAVATAGLCSVSDVARQAVLKAMHERGLLEGKKKSD